MLLYPSNATQFSKEDFIPFNPITDVVHHQCGLGKVSILKEDGKGLDDAIGDLILDWFTN
jgi:5-methylcytosine-specific restriction enzyme subunit McrC